MAYWLDVAGRLAEGRPAVERTDTYVRACQRVGCAVPALEIAEEYGSEDGLELRTLDRDCAELRAAGVAVAEALRMQRAQVAELAAAWTGPGADAAVAFLQRHCDTANAIATEIRAAAQRCESLRDNLWRMLDEKVTAAIAIDDRSLAQRPLWLAAAATLSTGVGDRHAAENVVRQEINPYVHNDIGNDWQNAMRSARTGVAAYYDMVNDRLASAPPASFEIPGELGPVGPPLRTPGVSPSGTSRGVAPPDAAAPGAAGPGAAGPGAAAPSLPKGFAVRSADAAAPTMTPPAGAPTQPLGAGPSAGANSPVPQSLSSLGSAGPLGGLGGLASRIVDAMGDVLGTDDLNGDGPLRDEADNDQQRERSHEPKHADRADEVDDDKKPTAQVNTQAAPRAVGPPHIVSGPAPDATQVVAPPAPTETATPCEIAADELPKAGQ